MPYDLCKELKNAGFPQEESGKYYDKTGKYVLIAHEEHNKDIMGAYIPTLSELIEACGDGFRYLLRGNEGSWEAAEGTLIGKHHFSVSCGTPEEAVARLYLALQANKL